MFQFQFKLTEREFARSLELNRTAVPLKWKSFVLVVVCLLPSVIAAWLMSATLTMFWFGVLVVVMAIYSMISFFRQAGSLRPYQQQIRFDQRLFENRFSNSVNQMAWSAVDGVHETEEAFLIEKLKRFTVLPKRAMGDQIDACRQFFKQTQSTSLESSGPVPLFNETVEIDSPFPVYRFRYQPDDMQKAVRSRFVRAIHPDRQTPPPAKASLTRVILLFALIAVLVGFMIPALGPAHDIVLSEILALILVWFLPAIMLVAIIKVIHIRRAARSGSIPEEECTTRLMVAGWAVGNPTAMTLLDWRDIDAIFESDDFYGFQSINFLLHLLPKRTFPDQEQAESFLSQAIELKQQQERRDEPVVAEVVETGNPFQSPLEQPKDEI